MSGGTLTNHLLGFSSILDEIVREYSPSVSGAFLSSILDPLFGPRSVCNLLVLRDFFDFDGCSGPVFGPLLDRTFAPTFQDFWNPVSSPCRFRTAVDTLPIRTLNCTPGHTLKLGK